MLIIKILFKKISSYGSKDTFNSISLYLHDISLSVLDLQDSDIRESRNPDYLTKTPAANEARRGDAVWGPDCWGCNCEDIISQIRTTGGNGGHHNPLMTVTPYLWY